MNERMKINPAEAAAAGAADARSLMEEMRTAEEGDNHGERMSDAMAKIIGLAVDNRIEECTARLEAFCGLVGPFVYTSFRVALTGKELIQAGSQWPRTDDEGRVIDAAIATCSRVTEGRIIAAHPKDDDAAVALAELQQAVDALDVESKFTETEGGEL